MTSKATLGSNGSKDKRHGLLGRSRHQQSRTEQLKAVVEKLKHAPKDIVLHVRTVGPHQFLKDVNDQCLMPCFIKCCELLSTSNIFSFVTTMLTIYALFGDDVRLLNFEKADDNYFDLLTIGCMVVFSIEIVAQTFGKAGYKYGFFFWLDILSTGTLILDVTAISEACFGDTISAAQRNGGSATSGGSGSGTEAARAARLSRVGTKAGRVVRLIRLVRLIRFIKIYKKGDYQDEPKEKAPGMDWEDDEEDVGNESAVSKKLSETTTRQVVILVLTIMLALPCFTTNMWISDLPYSEIYGINTLYRTWRSGLEKFKPLTGPTEWKAYLASKEREMYIDTFYQYAYYHNPFIIDSKVPKNTVSPADYLAKLFWVGVPNHGREQREMEAAKPVGENHTLHDTFLPRFFDAPVYDLNGHWNGLNNAFFAGNFTADPRGLLDKPWNETSLCIKDSHRGVGLLEHRNAVFRCPENLRYQERTVVYPSTIDAQEWEEMYFMFVFDRRTGSKMESMLNIFQTLFICVLLGVGAITFSNDANKYVLTPIERMIANVGKIRKNPLAAMSIDDQEKEKNASTTGKHKSQRKTMSHEQMLQAQSELSEWKENAKEPLLKKCWRKLLVFRAFFQKDKSSQPEPMETVVLEKTIIKIGSLLALGFGEAGAKIIAQNMTGEQEAVLNAIVPGRNVRVIFAFANIRNFSDATEILQEQVMIFVNRIAAYVHGIVNEFFGSPNHSIGDAFLLTWPLEGIRLEKESRLADMSLLALTKLTGAISRSSSLSEYKSHPKLAKRLPNYRVRLGLSLHTGWALEGAIGSEFKIDASYLSQNVSVTQKLENATKHYTVVMVLSDALVSMLSDGVAGFTRQIDYCTVPGWEDGPMRIHTLDLDDLALEGARSSLFGSSQIQHRSRAELRKKKAERWSDEFKMAEVFETDQEIEKMRKRFTSSFFALFRSAFLNFEAGEWTLARNLFLACRDETVVEDGPTSAHLRYIESFQGKAPDDWLGHHPLPQPK